VSFVFLGQKAIPNSFHHVSSKASPPQLPTACGSTRSAG
jgi:hypothetical protein